MGILSGLLTLLDTTNTILDSSECQKTETISKEFQKVLFLWYFSKKPSKLMDKAEYPHYLSYNCELDDISKFHKKMIDEGYFRISTIEEKLSMLTLLEIKKILNSFSLPTEGKKNVLIQNAIKNISQEKLAKILPKMYSLSQKGIDFIKKHDDCIKLHQHKDLNISWAEYICAKEEGFDFYDTI